MLKKGVNFPISISGDKAVVIRVGDEIENTNLCPLVYDFFKVNKHEETLFTFNTNNPDMKNAFTFGMRHFWYDENPLKGREIFSHNDFSVFELAKLGGGTDDQRFFYEPSIARTYISELVTNTVTNSDDTTETIISHQQIPYDAIIIGSGDRSDPLGFDNNDTLYMIKDSNVITKKFPTDTEPVIDKPDPILKNKLYDYTDDPYSGSMTEAELLNVSAASGWYINLLQNGEKASAAGIVVNGVVYFTSYTPAPDQTIIECKPPEGKGSLYAVDLALGIKRHNLTEEDVREDDNRVIILGKDWPAPPSIVIVPHPENPEEIQNNLTYKDKFIDVDTIFSTKRTYLYSTENQ